MLKEIAIADIRIDAGTQQRFEIDEKTVSQYANRMDEGDKFPAIDLVFDGATYFLYDGFHRYWATCKLKKHTIMANVEKGSRREAIWMSMNVNQKHGLRRAYADVEKMLVGTIFPDKDWIQETDIAIGDWIGCSPSYVSKKRKIYLKSLEATPEPEVKTETEDPADPAKEPKSEPVSIVVDELGHEVPKHLEVVFGRRTELKVHIKTISTIFKTIKDGVQKQDPLYANLKIDQMKADLSNIRTNIRFSLPYAVCPYCGGDVNNQECSLCNQRGFVNESTYKVVPDDMKG